MEERLAGVEQADAAAEGVIVLAMEGDEATAGAGEEGIGEFGKWARITTEASGDDVSGEGEDGVPGWVGNVHGRDILLRGRECAIEARNSDFWIFPAGQIIHQLIHRDFACGERGCARRWISEIGLGEKVRNFGRAVVYFRASSGMKVTGEIGERS